MANFKIVKSLETFLEVINHHSYFFCRDTDSSIEFVSKTNDNTNYYCYLYSVCSKVNESKRIAL